MSDKKHFVIDVLIDHFVVFESEPDGTPKVGGLSHSVTGYDWAMKYVAEHDGEPHATSAALELMFRQDGSPHRY